MTERAAPLATLAAIASSPDAVAASSAHLFAAVDALAAVFNTAAPADLPPRQRAMRSPRATWAAILSHAEHRLHRLNAQQPQQDDGA